MGLFNPGMLSKVSQIMKNGVPGAWDFIIGGIDKYIDSVPLLDGETSISPVFGKDENGNRLLVIAAFNDFTVVRTVEIINRENIEEFIKKINL